ncbi:MAG: glycosyltransferase family 39 protein [Planctomycetota bacterium]
MRRAILILIILVALAFAVRLAVAFNTRIISSDGPFYLNVAKDFAAGDYKAAFTKQTFHPLYPFLIALASNVISNWEWAGMLVSIILSALAVIPLYFIAKRYFNETVTVLACLLYGFHPQGAQLSASIFTTGAFTCILLFTLWATIIALEKGSYRYFILSGLLSFIMYLARPDGIVFAALAAVAVLINSRISGERPKQSLFKISALLIPWLLLIPNIFIVNALTGIFGLTGKVSGDTLAGMEMAKSFGGLYQFIVDFIKGANPVLFILFIIGGIWGHNAYCVKFPRKTLFIWLVFAGFILVFGLYSFADGRMSKRYTVPLFLIMMPWTAAGLYYIGEKISLKSANKIIWGITILILAILSVFTFKPVGKDKVIEKTTGELLGKYHIERSDIGNRSPVIITTLSRIAYYAGGVSVMPEGWDKANLQSGDFLQALKNTVQQRQADYLVLDSRIMRRFPGLEEQITPAFGHPPFRSPTGTKDGNGIKADYILPYLDCHGLDSYKVYRFSRRD